MNESGSDLSADWPFQPLPPPDRRPLKGRAVSAAGWIIIFGGFIAVTLGPIVLIAFILRESISDDALLTLFMVCVCVGVVLSVPIARFGRRVMLRGRGLRFEDAREVLARSVRRPVLLLRSFDDDALFDPGIYAGAFTTMVPYRYEQRLVRALERIGPPIALGKPGREFPYPGAARLFVSNDDWQLAVRHFIREAGAIVIVVGSGEWLWWEIETAFEHAKPEQVLFFFPYVTPERISPWTSIYRTLRGTITNPAMRDLEAGRDRRYAAFRERAERILPSAAQQNLPESLGDSLFLAFDPHWVPRLLPTQHPWFLRLMRATRGTIDFGRTLSPVIARMGAATRRSS